MIYIGNLTEEDVGKKVIYQNVEMEPKEEGIITSWNDHYIFVRYGSDVGSKATYPRDLQFVTPEQTKKEAND